MGLEQMEGNRGGRQKPGKESLEGCVKDKGRIESHGGGCVLPSLLHCKLPKTQGLYQNSLTTRKFHLQRIIITFCSGSSRIFNWS